MPYEFTAEQEKRLKELNYPIKKSMFSSEQERDDAFRQEEKSAARRTRERITAYEAMAGAPGIKRLERRLAGALSAAGFIEVATPTIISAAMLKKMTIDLDHELYSQVFWLDGRKKCLRPMLAPNLYDISRSLLKTLGEDGKKPVRIFEIGSCFRKESQGATHLNEFTMCNLVEWNTPLELRQQHMAEFAAIVMETAGLKDYQLISEESVVYGGTTDVMFHDIEVASGAIGPHFLDGKWGITGSWVGLGFGLERLLMLGEAGQNVKCYSRSLTYLDGMRLNV